MIKKQKKSIIQAEGEEKPKEKKTRKAKPAEFPVDAKINDYGFLHFKVGVLTALGWKKGMTLKIERNEDGSITVRKA